MSKRSRSRKQTEDARPADHKVSADFITAETPWNAEGTAFAEFDAQIDSELETLVSRWIHLAAPGSNSVRRSLRHAARSTTGQV